MDRGGASGKEKIKNQYICIYIAPDRIKIISRCFTETQGLTSSGKGKKTFIRKKPSAALSSYGGDPPVDGRLGRVVGRQR